MQAGQFTNRYSIFATDNEDEDASSDTRALDVEYSIDAVPDRTSTPAVLNPDFEATSRPPLEPSSAASSVTSKTAAQAFSPARPPTTRKADAVTSPSENVFHEDRRDQVRVAMNAKSDAGHDAPPQSTARRSNKQVVSIAEAHQRLLSQPPVPGATDVARPIAGRARSASVQFLGSTTPQTTIPADFYKLSDDPGAPKPQTAEAASYFKQLLAYIDKLALGKNEAIAHGGGVASASTQGSEDMEISSGSGSSAAPKPAAVFKIKTEPEEAYVRRRSESRSCAPSRAAPSRAAPPVFPRDGDAPPAEAPGFEWPPIEPEDAEMRDEPQYHAANDEYEEDAAQAMPAVFANATCHVSVSQDNEPIDGMEEDAHLDGLDPEQRAVWDALPEPKFVLQAVRMGNNTDIANMDPLAAHSRATRVLQAAAPGEPFELAPAMQDSKSRMRLRPGLFLVHTTTPELRTGGTAGRFLVIDDVNFISYGYKVRNSGFIGTMGGTVLTEDELRAHAILAWFRKQEVKVVFDKYEPHYLPHYRDINHTSPRCAARYGKSAALLRAEFADSVEVYAMRVVIEGEEVTQYNIYAKTGYMSRSLFRELRHAISITPVIHSLKGKGKIITPGWLCTACTGTSHPKGLCRTGEVEGWNRPLSGPSSRGGFGAGRGRGRGH